jgi:hypothetical protein
MGCAYFAILAIKRGNPRYWLWFGVIAGIGLQEKYSIALFGFGMVVGLLLTAQRRVFLNPWIWLGGLASVLDLPAQPAVEHPLSLALPRTHAQHPRRRPRRHSSSAAILLSADPAVHPFTAPIWLTGLFALLFSARLKPYRALGWCYLVCFTALLCSSRKELLSRPRLSHAARRRRRRRSNPPSTASTSESKVSQKTTHSTSRWHKPVIVVILLAGGAHLVPIIVPGSFS